jgi:uncharacterized protein with von Willebrand factor type A (vWA) domain
VSNKKASLLSVRDSIADQYKDLLAASSRVEDYLDEEIFAWEKQYKRHLAIEYPFEMEDSLQSKITRPHQHVSQYHDYVKNYKYICTKFGSPLNPYWDLEAKKFAKLEHDSCPLSSISDLPDFEHSIKLLRYETDRILNTAKLEWELAVMMMFKEKLLKTLYEKLDAFHKLYLTTIAFGLSPGLFFDLSDGILTDTNLKQLKYWTDFLKNNKGLEELLDLMGRISSAKMDKKKEKIFLTDEELIPVPDINSKEEIIGLTLGRDIESIVPSELALLTSEDTSILFDLKYLESSLLCFDMNGANFEKRECTISAEKIIEEEEKKGPIIICVDTSSSMQGAPEAIAKAITLLMATKASSSRRSCYLINFSTNIETLSLSDAFSMKSLLSFLKKSFHGGTDAQPAITHGINLMSSNDYKKADMLIISDFTMDSLPHDTIELMKAARCNGNTFNSLVVGNCFMNNRLENIFDYEWIYDPKTSDIRELIRFEEKIFKI